MSTMVVSVTTSTPAVDNAALFRACSLSIRSSLWPGLLKLIAPLFVGASVGFAANALDAERVQSLYDVVEQSMRCEVLAAYSHNPAEAQRLREVATRAGYEIGMSMAADNLDTTHVDLPRCGRHFKVLPAENWDEVSFALALGFELGELRSCAHELLLRDGDLSAEPSDGNVLDEEWAKRVEEKAAALFDQRNCALIQLP